MHTIQQDAARLPGLLPAEVACVRIVPEVSDGSCVQQPLTKVQWLSSPGSPLVAERKRPSTQPNDMQLNQVEQTHSNNMI